MAVNEPTFYILEKKAGSSGVAPEDIHRILWNLQAALYALMDNLDDVGIAGTEYRTKIGTYLQTAHNLLVEPISGTTVSERGD